MEVDFYIVKGTGAQDAPRVACRLAEKAWSMGRNVFIHAADDSALREIDELLWTFKQESFVPHDVVTGSTDPHAEHAPVLIGSDASENLALDVVINLSLALPPFYARSQRVAEIVAADETSQQAGRGRYRHYRDAGCTLRSHNV